MSEIKVLIEGYTSGETNGRSCSTVVLIKDDFDGVEMNIVVDPGTLSSQQALIDELKKEGVKPKDVDIVVITHSHMDHYANIGMFSNAKSLSFDGWYNYDFWGKCNGKISNDLKLIKTPGHSDDSITLLVKTKIDGKPAIVAICGDVFWKENLPKKDKFANNEVELMKSRKKVLKIADYIIPGHGGMYKVNN
ncbi:MBL fold metallo-hydrolase [Candidatus Woesearchaeota archaeon]|jgi:glyoxylase-like metal-dependent hydrolase (beta-lactamase superfamily II)|nr:MBL fold metallo-hydrolase [Candidatus Woesearchaeota archaeon]